ncbi:MAG TPA: VWA domain-containing protein, partial [Polyangiaceae bacterium]|nr:VWA domain-containing protein [Polyangiaceae bacterium]
GGTSAVATGGTATGGTGTGGSGGASGFNSADSGNVDPCANGACDVDSGAQCTADGGVCAATQSATPVIASTQQALSDDMICPGIDRSTPATLYESADDSNSMASPAVARRLIRQGLNVPASIIRPYEFLNYYRFAFEPAQQGEVRIVPQLSSCAEDGKISLQVALQSELRANDERAPLNLTFVLDTSGSMQGQPIANLQASVRAIASVLRAGDVVSMVTWNTEQLDALVSHEVSGPNDPAILSVTEQLSADGGTDLSGGLNRGYQLAVAQRSPGRINRVVLISDGIANVGVTDAQTIGSYADDEEGGEGIYLAGIGVGDGVNDTLMDAVTDAGRGAYLYVDSPEEAQHMLADRFLEVMDVAARAVRLEVNLPWYLKVQQFYGEQISTNAALVRPQHLAPNSAMVFFQLLQACPGAEMHGDDRIRLRATWQTPFTRQDKEAVIDTTLNDLAGQDGQIEKGAAIASYAQALIDSDGQTGSARFEILQHALTDVENAEHGAADPDLAEIATLLHTYMQL